MTYDENGGYGHPDHIQAHRVAMRAVELAARPGFRRRRAPSRGRSRRSTGTPVPSRGCATACGRLREAGDVTFFEGLDPDADELPAGHARRARSPPRSSRQDHVDAKLAAMRAHATQITVDGPFFALSNNLGNEVWGIEYYRLVHGTPGTERDVDGRETDLFAGLD